MGFQWDLTAAALRKSWGAASPTAREGLVCSIIWQSSLAVLPHAMHSPRIPVGLFLGGFRLAPGLPRLLLATAARFLP